MSTNLEKPDIATTGDGFTFTWPLTGVQVELDNFADKKGELRAEMTVIRALSGQEPKLLCDGEINLLAIPTRERLAKYLEGQEHDVPWVKLLEVLCFMARRKHRDGVPAKHVRDITESTLPRFALRPYVEYERPSVLFGPGSSTKTYGGVAAAVTWATRLPIFGEPTGDAGAVLFIDYETHERGWKRRVQAIMRGHGITEFPEVFYRKLYVPFVDAAPGLLKEAHRLGIKYLVIDSLAAAVGGELVDPRYILPFFTAVGRFELPALVISHISADGVKNENNGHLTPYGSIYTENCCGNTISIRNRSEPGQPVANVFLRNEKVNDGAKFPDHGYMVTFQNEPSDPDLTRSATYDKLSAQNMPAFRDKLPVGQRIMAYLLQTGPAGLQDIADDLDLPVNQITARARDLLKRGEIIQFPDKRYGPGAPQREPEDGETA